jgi:hypothetical protein
MAKTVGDFLFERLKVWAYAGFPAIPAVDCAEFVA